MNRPAVMGTVAASAPAPGSSPGTRPMPAALLLTTLAVPFGHVEEGAAGEPVALFDGKSLAGWTPVLPNDPDTDPTTVWGIKEGGVLTCTGKPAGYLKTDRDDWANYKLELEWRWPGQPGNNGVLVHSSTPRALNIWPRSQEVQLAHQNAGDFWVIGTDLTVPLEGVPGYEDRVRGRRHLNFTDGTENPPGEWNTITIVARGDTITVLVNGTVVNHGTGSDVTSGAICLQSEGAAIEYRKIRLTPLGE